MTEEHANGRSKRALTRTVVALGLVSFFTDAASDMIWPLLPVLLASTMHTTVAWAGVIEGAADATAALVKYIVGKRSDQLRRRKPFVLGGYTISSVARPLLAIATLPWHALIVRVVDRVGKGLRSAPRDALIAEDTPREQRAVAFGFHRAMDNAGAVVGPLAAVGILSLWRDNVRAVALATAVPGALAVLAIVLLVRDRPREPAASSAPASAPAKSTELSHEFKQYLAIVALFTLGNASDVFIVAQALRSGASVRDAALVWAALALGWLVYALAYAAFPLARGTAALVAVSVVYGLYYGLTEGAEKALVASFAEERSLGRAYGLFALVTGVGSLVASLLFAALLSLGDGRYAWWTSALLALVAAVSLAVVRPRVRETPPG